LSSYSSRRRGRLLLVRAETPAESLIAGTHTGE